MEIINTECIYEEFNIAQNKKKCELNFVILFHLQHSCHLETPKVKHLPKNIIDIKVLKALNMSTRTEGPIVTSVEFHPSSTVALVAGVSGVLSLFQVFIEIKITFKLT